MSDTRVYGGLTAEERRAQRREQLLAAGLEVFSRKGWAATTVLDLCREARLSQRYFYEAFPSREALFEALLEQIGSEVASLVRDVFDHSSGEEPSERVRRVLSALIDLMLDDPRKARVTLVESFATPDLRDRRRQALAAFAQLGAHQLRRLPGVTRRRPLELTATVMTGGIAEVLVAAVTSGEQPDRVELVDHLTDMWLCAATGSS